MIINHVCNVNNWVKPESIKGLKTLILGSFNPYNPNEVNTDYYYGRSSNYFWKAIASILEKEEDYFTSNLDNKLDVMEHYKFAFSDVISSIKVINSENNSSIVNQFIDKHILTDFSDSKLFTTKHKKAKIVVERTYNTDIIDLINKSNIMKVIHTMGNNTIKLNFKTQPLEKGLGIKGFQGYINTIKNSNLYFEPVSHSPSQITVHRGGEEYFFKLKNWLKENLEINKYNK